MAFWNVAGLRDKGREFWQEIKKWDVVMFSETWMDSGEWEEVKGMAPGGFIWKVQDAKKESLKGRKKGGMISGVRECLLGREEGEVEGGEQEREGIMVRRVKAGGYRYVVVGVYMVKGDEARRAGVRYWLENKRKEVVVIGGDFNAWTGRGGGAVWGEEVGGEVSSRRSKDGRVDAEGRKLLEMLGGAGGIICNGCTEGDREGEVTFIGRGETVIDYVIGDERMREHLCRMRVGMEVGSDHFPVIAYMKGGRRETGKSRVRGSRKVCKLGSWGEEKLRRFKAWMEGRRDDTELGGGRWLRRVRKEVDRAKEEIEGGGELGGKEGWWDEECELERREVKRVVREYRKGRVAVEVMRGQKKRYESLLKRKKEEEEDRFKLEVEQAVRRGKVWEIINRERKGKKGQRNDIKMEEWTTYFENVLGGVRWRVIGGKRRRGTVEVVGEERITREEVGKVVEGLRRGKAAGIDGLENEVWRFGGEGMEDALWRMCWRAWDGRGVPEEWKTGVIIPIPKKAEAKKVEEFRGITLMPTSYKVYAEVLRRRLEGEADRLGAIPHNQAGFRRGMGTMDNIYVLNYLANRKIGEKKGKLVVMFVDFKAAFDSVDREILWRAMGERGFSAALIERIRELYEETECRVKVGGEVGESFWTGRGVRQGCPLSPLLFSILISDLEERLAGRGKGGTCVYYRRLYSLAYADDLALIADNGEGMRMMVREFEGYVREKGLVVNVGKTKVMVFQRGQGGREERGEVWKINGEEVEQVEEFCYLGYWMERKGTQEAHVKRRVECAGQVMGRVWELGRRRFRDRWRLRMWLFDVLVWSVMGYGVEIWGWKERRRVEAIQERYIRWILGVSGACPGYMVRKEANRSCLRLRQRKRAWGFEEKLRRGEGSLWARLCLQELGESGGRGEGGGGSKWGKERELGRREIGARVGESWGQVEEREKRKEEQEVWKKVVDSGYNRWYKWIGVEGCPKYLECVKKEKNWRLLARFRLGEGMREARYWEDEEKRRCRVCGGEEETWEHVWERCRGGGVGEESVVDRVKIILDEGGGGLGWIKELECYRGQRGGGLGEEW